MVNKVELRLQRVSDAKRFYEILNHPDFTFFSSCPKSIEAEKEYLKKNIQKRKNHFSYDYTILYNKKLVGGCGMKINQHTNFIGEIGYFIDRNYWGKGIASKAVKLIEKKGFKELKLRRIEVIMCTQNLASERVAIKCGYKKEGIKKKAIKVGKNKYEDAYLYAKIK